MKSYNWGILGAGAAAYEFAKGLKLVSGSAIRSVHCRTQTKAIHFANTFQTEKTYKELHSFLDDPGVDIVYIATPNNLHCEHAVQSLKAGKHVLIEKPFALNVFQAQKIIEAARQNHRFCMEAMWTRFMPVYSEIKKLLKKNLLGEVTYFKADFGQNMPYDPHSRLFRQESGGGCLLDLGVYPVSLALMLLGEPEHVTGVCTKAKSGVDTHDLITLNYKSGAIADLQCSFNYRMPNNIWISGTKGSLEIPGPIYRPNRYRFTRHASAKGQSHYGYSKREKLHEIPALSRILQITGDYLIHPFYQFNKTRWVPFYANGYQYEAQEVINNLSRGALESVTMPLSDSKAVLKITDTLRKDWGIVYPDLKTEINYL